MADRSVKPVDETAVTRPVPFLRRGVMSPRRDSSGLVPVVILGGAMSMTLLGAIAWMQMQQRACPDARPTPTRTVIVQLPPEPPPPTVPDRPQPAPELPAELRGAPCPSYGQRGIDSAEYAAANDCIGSLTDEAALREQATRDAVQQLER